MYEEAGENAHFLHAWERTEVESLPTRAGKKKLRWNSHYGLAGVEAVGEDRLPVSPGDSDQSQSDVESGLCCQPGSFFCSSHP